MPGGLPIGWELCNGSNSAGVGNVPGTRGINIPANSGVAGTFSSWVPIITTVFDIDWMEVAVARVSAAATSVVVQLGVGATGGSEKVFATVEEADFGLCTYNYDFPVAIPAGTTISARSTSSNTTTENVYVALGMFQGKFSGPDGSAGLDMYASATSGAGVSYGTLVQPDLVVSNKKGAWTPIVASTLKDYIGFFVAIDAAGNNSSFPSSATTRVMFDVGIGASGSEKIIVPNITCSIIAAGTITGGCFGPFYVPIPAGTKISVRSQQSFDSSTANLGYSFFGIYR